MKSILQLGALALVLMLAGPPDRAQAVPVPAGDVKITVAARVTGSFVSPAAAERPGFDIELLRRFTVWYHTQTGKQARLEIEYMPTVPALLEAVRKGTDLGVGGITVTAERARLVDFSVPSLPVRSVLVALPGVLDAASWRAGIRGRRLGALKGGTSIALAEGLKVALGDLEVASFPSDEKVFEALVGRPATIDAAIVDLPEYWTTGKARGLVLIDSLGEPQSLAVAIHKGSPLGRPMDDFLTYFTHSANYFQLIERYFGHDAAQMVRMSRGRP